MVIGNQGNRLLIWQLTKLEPQIKVTVNLIPIWEFNCASKKLWGRALLLACVDCKA
jgi:hypothetical protein